MPPFAGAALTTVPQGCSPKAGLNSRVAGCRRRHVGVQEEEPLLQPAEVAHPCDDLLARVAALRKLMPARASQLIICATKRSLVAAVIQGCPRRRRARASGRRRRAWHGGRGHRRGAAADVGGRDGDEAPVGQRDDLRMARAEFERFSRAPARARECGRQRCRRAGARDAEEPAGRRAVAHAQPWRAARTSRGASAWPPPDRRRRGRRSVRSRCRRAPATATDSRGRVPWASCSSVHWPWPGERVPTSLDSCACRNARASRPSKPSRPKSSSGQRNVSGRV